MSKFISKLDAATREEMGRRAASMFNEAGVLSIPVDPESQAKPRIYTYGIGGYIRSSGGPTSANTTFKGMGLCKDWAHNLVWQSGMSYGKMWLTQDPKIVEERLKENPNLNRKQITSIRDMLIIVATGKVAASGPRKFVESVWEQDEEFGAGILNESTEGVYHEFITVEDLYPYLEDKPRKKGKTYGEGKFSKKAERTNPMSGKECLEEFLRARRIPACNILFLPLGSGVQGRERRWTNNRERDVEAILAEAQNTEETTEETSVVDDNISAAGSI